MKKIFTKKVIFSLTGLFLFYLLGFAFFATSLSKQAPPAIDDTVDALVVFTGSAGRIEQGFDYLQSFTGPMLISGVHENVNLNQLNGVDLLKKAQHQRIILDYTATSTRENVRVTTAWAEKNNFKNIGVITAAFHMPRSLLLFKQQAPQLQVSPYPSKAIHPSLSILLREYNKLLAASIRLL